MFGLICLVSCLLLRAAHGIVLVIAHLSPVCAHDGQECLELRNYSSLMAIVSGLQNAAIDRLKHSWNVRSSACTWVVPSLSNAKMNAVPCTLTWALASGGVMVMRNSYRLSVGADFKTQNLPTPPRNHGTGE